MPEPHPDYTTQTDQELLECALANLTACLTPREIFVLAVRVRRRAEIGFGALRAEWLDGRPILLTDEEPTRWDDRGLK